VQHRLTVVDPAARNNLPAASQLLAVIILIWSSGSSSFFTPTQARVVIELASEASDATA
jgi:hypothetical protein